MRSALRKNPWRSWRLGERESGFGPVHAADPAGQQDCAPAAGDQPVSGSLASNCYEKQEKQTVVKKCIAALPPKYRIAILMSYYQQLPYKEIANRLDCSMGAVKSMIHRSKLMIKENLKNEDLINKYDVKSCWSYPLHQIHLRQLT